MHPVSTGNSVITIAIADWRETVAQMAEWFDGSTISARVPWLQPADRR
jgi:hypothetical protein